MPRALAISPLLALVTVLVWINGLRTYRRFGAPGLPLVGTKHMQSPSRCCAARIATFRAAGSGLTQSAYPILAGQQADAKYSQARRDGCELLHISLANAGIGSL